MIDVVLTKEPSFTAQAFPSTPLRSFMHQTTCTRAKNHEHATVRDCHYMASCALVCPLPPVDPSTSGVKAARCATGEDCDETGRSHPLALWLPYGGDSARQRRGVNKMQCTSNGREQERRNKTGQTKTAKEERAAKKNSEQRRTKIDVGCAQKEQENKKITHQVGRWLVKQAVGRCCTHATVV